MACMAAVAAIAMSACNGGDDADANGSDDAAKFVTFPVRNDHMAPKFPLVEESVCGQLRC